MLTEVTVGRVGRAHGVHGELYVDARTDEPERRFVPGQVVQPRRAGPRRHDHERDAAQTGDDGQQPGLTIRRARRHQQRWLITFAEVADRDAAESLRGVWLVCAVPADERPAESEEYYDRQLVGLAVHTPSQSEPVGTVRSVLHHAAQDVLEVAVADEVRLVPFVTALVPEIDLTAQTLTIADVAGLLTDSEDTGPEGAGANSG